MSGVWWVVITALVVVAVALVVAMRGRLKAGGTIFGHKFDLEAGRPAQASRAVVEDVQGRNVLTEAAGDSKVSRIDASGDVTTRAGMPHEDRQDPKKG